METRTQSVAQLHPQAWPPRHLSHFQDESLPVKAKMFHTSWTSSYRIISTFWYPSLWCLHHDFGMGQDKRLTYLIPFCYYSWVAFHLSPGFVQSHDLPICCYLCARDAEFCAWDVDMLKDGNRQYPWSAQMTLALETLPSLVVCQTCWSLCSLCLLPFCRSCTLHQVFWSPLHSKWIPEPLHYWF